MKVDRNSGTWIAVEALADRYEQSALTALRSKSTDREDTQFFRGVLSFIDALRDIEHFDSQPVISTGPAYEPAASS